MHDYLAARRPSPEAKRKIFMYFDHDIVIPTILSLIRTEYPGTLISLRDVHNLRMEHRYKKNQENYEAQVKQAQIEQARIEQAQIEQAQIEQAQIEQAQIEQAQMEQAHIEKAHIEQAHIEHPKFNRLKLKYSSSNVAYGPGVSFKKFFFFFH